MNGISSISPALVWSSGTRRPHAELEAQRGAETSDSPFYQSVRQDLACRE